MSPASVRDLMRLSPTSPRLVRGDASLAQVVRILLEDRSSYETYVVDAEGRFLGVITAQRVAQHLFTRQAPRQESAVDLLEMLTAESAEHLAVRATPCVHEGDPLARVIDVLLRHGLIEVPVLDDERRIVGSLNLLHVLAAWSEGRL